MVSERVTLKKISFLIRYVAGGRVILHFFPGEKGKKNNFFFTWLLGSSHSWFQSYMRLTENTANYLCTVYPDPGFQARGYSST